MTPRIGVFCPTLNVCGGGEYVAIVIANTLASNGYDVVLFSSGKVDTQAIKNYFGETLHPKIQTLQQPTNFTPHGLGDFYQTIFHSYIAKSKCGAFIDAFSNCVYPWTQISYIHYPCLNHHAFAAAFPYLNRPRFSQACTAPYLALEKNLIDYNKRLVLANSYYTAKEIQRCSHKTARVLYPPFSESIRAMGQKAKKAEEENLVVTVSRLDSNKQLERIPLIAAQTPKNVHFAVVGRLFSPPLLNYLQALTEKMGLTDRVKFYPNASATEKADLLKRAKLYLHTMEGEHFGISIVEAMAMGCLPVVHDSGGMREFVPVQYRYSSLQGAAEKIVDELAAWSPDKAEAMKAAASEFSTQKFSEHFMEYFNEYFTSA